MIVVVVPGGGAVPVPTPAGALPTALASPEELGLRALVGLLYPLLLLVGIRLVRMALRRARTALAHRLDDGESWLLAAGIPEQRARALRRSGDLASRVAELAVYLLFVYAFSSYFFVLFPETRTLGLGLLELLWPPIRAAFVLAFRTLTYTAFALLVALGARWLVRRIRSRLGAEVARPASPQERERLVVLRALVSTVAFLAVLVVLAVLPGPGKVLGAVLLLVMAAVILIALRRSLENVAAGFVVGRSLAARRGGRLRIGSLHGTVEEWAATGIRLVTDAGEQVFVPYRILEQEPVAILDAEAANE